MSSLLQKIQARTATVGVIGLGYVGLPLAVEFAKAGFRVFGIDLDKRKIKLLKEGKNYIPDVPDSEILSLVTTKPSVKGPGTRVPALSGSLIPTSDYSVLREVDCISICVPTPLNKTKDPDVSFILNAVEEVTRTLHRGQLIVLESTSYPGTTRELLLPRLEAAGLKIDQDFYLAFSPERIDPGNKVYTLRNTPKVLGGITPTSCQVAAALYAQIVETVVPVSCAESAEMVKLLENTFRIVNIGLVNEVALMCDKLGIDVWEVIAAGATKPYGFMPFYPGPGLGGHCIPVDPMYLSWKLKTLNYKARFIELAGEINAEMPQYVVDKVADALNRVKKSVNGSKILVLGVAYKKDIGDIRESPALDIIRLLRDKGATVRWHDSHVADVEDLGPESRVETLTPRDLSGADCVVIVTDHSEYDWTWVMKSSVMIVDTRNALRGLGEGTDKVVKL